MTRTDLTRLSVLAGTLLLVACTASSPAPVEDREVETRVRAPAREGNSGIQVYPLKNPAVAELTADAQRAEAAGDFEQATVLLERALRIQPRDPELLQHMAEVQVERQAWDQALSFAERSYDTGPRVGEICARNWRTIALARERLGDKGGAREAENRAQDCPVTPPQRF